MFVEIVFVGLPIDRDEVEEALESEFEVTGAGSGMGRCHLDLEIVEDTTAALERLRAVLSDLGVADCATLNVSE
ncbi:hypothetical protein [Amycolatopsis keratiniphila]|uniref:hypothetical protein n=1 Tax=Amycolatopsis keratiniphila TaxID=129921 RepID=UPI000879AAD4|nr:hypothetical protein [Amycolatopsis keratiniphila]OLZ58515.1 hypothetical protein BS330_11250 [Amycolatopsis keratiniphila subsp. nogabecina]SDU01547.1 hypothetical protein SAMN04489733_0404 [Amycolatopsis keratiniphila]